MYKLSVTLRLEDGRQMSGIARDTGYDKDKKEYIMLEVNGESTLVELDTVLSLKANVENPHFDLVRFK
jgi:Rho-binding antiterminator